MVSQKREGKADMFVVDWDKLVNDEKYWHLLEVLEKIAKDHGQF